LSTPTSGLTELSKGVLHMATIDQQATGADLQALAKRHLWRHLRRMGAYADHDVPVIVRGEGCSVFDDHDPPC
jgi:hypothetical protein